QRLARRLGTVNVALQHLRAARRLPQGRPAVEQEQLKTARNGELAGRRRNNPRASDEQNLHVTLLYYFGIGRFYFKPPGLARARFSDVPQARASVSAP